MTRSADRGLDVPICRATFRAYYFSTRVGLGGMSHCVCHTKLSQFEKYLPLLHGYLILISCVLLLTCLFVSDSRHKKKTTFIGGMELGSLRCNRDFTSYSPCCFGAIEVPQNHIARCITLICGKLWHTLSIICLDIRGISIAYIEITTSD